MALPQPKAPVSASDFLAWDAIQTMRHECVNSEWFADLVATGDGAEVA